MPGCKSPSVLCVSALFKLKQLFLRPQKVQKCLHCRDQPYVLQLNTKTPLTISTCKVKTKGAISEAISIINKNSGDNQLGFPVNERTPSGRGNKYLLNNECSLL